MQRHVDRSSPEPLHACTGLHPDKKISLKEVFEWVEELNQIGAALSAEEDIGLLLQAILVAAKNIVNADGGTIYRVMDGEWIRFETLMTDSLGVSMGGATGNAITFPPIRLYDENGAPNSAHVVAYSVLNGRTVNIGDAYTEKGFDFSGTRKFDEMTGYRSKSFLTIPMKNHEREIIGVLQLINAKDRATGEIVGFSMGDQRFAESLASQAAIVLTNRQLVTQLEELFEAFVGVINAAIDNKSPHTGMHCQRVPMLTMMLAEAVHDTEEGPLKDFRMTDRDRFELRIAGLLHDCGKIITPAHVMEKATKLETVFDRINLVEARFEILKREARIGFLEAAMASPENREILEKSYLERISALDEDMNFLRQCNIGTELMPDEDVAKVHEIAGRYRLDGKNVLSRDCVENLTVRRGTLTKAEREIINAHIDVTIDMLESLPWPNRLKHVPEYAGGHHERMDGTGYPKGLKREDMSVQARIMGIADIFEALTARDRPYKKGKTLSETLAILGKFCLEHHIDPDIFDVFVRQRVYLQYAREFMEPEQIDEVDVSKIPGYAP